MDKELSGGGSDSEKGGKKEKKTGSKVDGVSYCGSECTFGKTRLETGHNGENPYGC